jgi:hypothetical protein
MGQQAIVNALQAYKATIDVHSNSCDANFTLATFNQDLNPVLPRIYTRLAEVWTASRAAEDIPLDIWTELQCL